MVFLRPTAVSWKDRDTGTQPMVVLNHISVGTLVNNPEYVQENTSESITLTAGAIVFTALPEKHLSK